MRGIYRLLSLFGIARAAARGPAELGRNYIRRRSHGALAGLLRRLLSPRR